MICATYTKPITSCSFGIKWHDARVQWRSKALRGPGSTVTWGPIPSLPSFPFPYPSPLSRSSFPLPPFPSPSFPSPSPLFPSSPPLPLEVGPFNPARGLGSAVSSPSGVWGGAPAEIEVQSLTFGGNKFTDFCENQLTKFCTVYTMNAIFFIVYGKFFCGPTTRGPKELWGPVSLTT